MTTSQDVVDWYERNTESILHKYGPGPKVHFHGGLIEPDLVPAPNIEQVRQQLVQSQEDLLREAARFWEAECHLSGTILDVGCGLGGGSIFWAQEYGARVFALTNVPGHLHWITHFAAQAGVAEQVVPLLGDACAIPGEQIFDAAVAVDSSCYIDRKAWFRHLSLRMRPEGRVCIEDSFAQSEGIRQPFDRYFLTRIGTLDEYRLASVTAGFELDGILDLTPRIARFWEFSTLYLRHILETGVATEEEARLLEHGIRWETQFLEWWTKGKISTALLSFVHL
jgi:SAM-dependent methyltransferase